MNTNCMTWYWQLCSASFLAIGGAIASSGNYAFAQITPNPIPSGLQVQQCQPTELGQTQLCALPYPEPTKHPPNSPAVQAPPDPSDLPASAQTEQLDLPASAQTEQMQQLNQTTIENQAQ